MTEQELLDLNERVWNNLLDARAKKRNLGGSDHMGASAAGGIVVLTPETEKQAQNVVDFLEGKLSARGERLRD